MSKKRVWPIFFLFVLIGALGSNPLRSHAAVTLSCLGHQSTILGDQVVLGQAFQGTVIITMPDGDIALIEPGDDIPNIPSGSTIEVFDGMVNVSGDNSATLSCGGDVGELQVQKGFLDILDAHGKKMRLEEGAKFTIAERARAYIVRQGKRKAVSAGMVYQKGDILKSTQGTRIDVGMHGLVGVRLMGDTEVRIEKTDPDEMIVELITGNVLVNAKKGLKNGQFKLKTPNAVACVWGTQFMARACNLNDLLITSFAMRESRIGFGLKGETCEQASLEEGMAVDLPEGFKDLEVRRATREEKELMSQIPHIDFGGSGAGTSILSIGEGFGSCDDERQAPPTAGRQFTGGTPIDTGIEPDSRNIRHSVSQ